MEERVLLLIVTIWVEPFLRLLFEEFRELFFYTWTHW